MKKLLSFLLVFLAFSPTAYASVARDTSASGGQVSGSPASGTISITPAPLTNGIGVCNFNADSWTGTLSAPTFSWGGSAMTAGTTNVDSTNKQALEHFYILNPPSGATTVTWTQGATKATNVRTSCATYSGVNQTTPFETNTATAQGNTAVTTVNLTNPSITATDWGIVYAISGRSISASTGLTQVQNPNTNGFFGDTNGTTATGNTLSVTLNANGTVTDLLAVYLEAAPITVTSSLGDVILFN